MTFNPKNIPLIFEESYFYDLLSILKFFALLKCIICAFQVEIYHFLETLEVHK